MTKYSGDHLWIRQESDGFRVGLTDYAQKELGEITYVELPETGFHVDEGDVFGSLDSLKSSSDLYAPFSGTIVAVNDKLTAPGGAARINADPDGDGWIAIIRPDDRTVFLRLMDENEYTNYVGA